MIRTRPADDEPGDERQWSLEARVDLARPAIEAIARTLYGGRHDIELLVETWFGDVRAAAGARPASLRELDVRRSTNPDWFLMTDQIGYVAYADRFGGTIDGVGTHLDYLSELRVTYFHLMKVIRARQGANDGGYAVVDYGDVDSALGTRKDLENLADELRRRGISLCLDVVINHTAREHPWARAAAAGSEPHRAYYHVFPDRTLPDRYEQHLPEVFPEIAPGNFTWEPDMGAEGTGAWVWTTFNTYQWDLNYANPDVFREALRVVLDLANLGVDVMRLDAIAFTWKRLGTDCQNQPEAHLIAQLLRALVAIAAPGVLLKAEAIVSPEQLVPYLGAHQRQRRECHVAYHNQLMVMLWSSIASQDARLATEALSALPPTPADATWVTYLRCHDDIGWAVSDRDADAAEMSAEGHRRFLASFYSGGFPASYAEGGLFSSNPASGDVRTTGSAAALCGISSARTAVAANPTDPHAAAMLDLAVRRLLLAYGVVISFGGIPLIYMGDELALDNDLSYLDDPMLADDSRWMNRPWMDWALAERRKVPGTVEHRVFGALQRMIDVRRVTPMLAGGGRTWIHRYDAPSVLAWAHDHPRHGVFFGVVNFAEVAARIPSSCFGYAGLLRPLDVLGSGLARVVGDDLVIEPLGIAWYTDAAESSVCPVGAD